jgi:hypothetical protein
MKLDRMSDIQLLKLAIILHEVYQSFDACAFVLPQYSKRRQDDLASKYIRHLTGGI